MLPCLMRNSGIMKRKLARQRKVIMYVNFSPYTNAGHFLQYLTDSFETVIVVTFIFYPLGNMQDHAHVVIYKNGKIQKTLPIFQLSVPRSLIFFLLPLRSIFFLIQLLYYSARFKQSFGRIHFFLTVNAFTAWCGNVMKLFGLVDNTIYWVWDYYPPIHNHLVISIMRMFYRWFDAWGITYANRVAFLNARIKERHTIRLEQKGNIVPIGTTSRHISHRAIHTPLQIMFFGVVKRSQGLDLVFNALEKSPKKTFDLHIVGSGPDIFLYQEWAKKLKQTIIFHGYIPSEKIIDTILLSGDIGLAPYMPDPSNISYYTDPSKIKRYISVGLPVITTNVCSIAEEIEKTNTGIVIPYTSDDLITAIYTIKKSYKKYTRGAYSFAKQFNYLSVYPRLFT